METPDNLYAPPGANLAPAARHSRTAPVYIIAAWCCIQITAVGYFMVTNWQALLTPLQMGAESVPGFIGRLLFPILLFVSGLQLFFMRKSACYAFGLYFAWSLQKLLWQPGSGLGPFDIMITTGIWVYCVRLHRAGKLN